MDWKFELQDKENVGTIELSNKVRVSDPCYDKDTWCAGTLENVLSGTYQCFLQRRNTGDWGIRIANIEVRHKDYLDVEPTEVQNIDVGVDSGQCGIYDLEYFIEARKDEDSEDEWYDRICEATYKVIENPEYHPFKSSSFWKPEFEECERYIDEHHTMPPVELFKEWLQAEGKYRDSIEHYAFIHKLDASVMDNKCLVSSSGDGDGSYLCYVGRNDDSQIVSIKIDYYPVYDEDEEDYEE